MIEIIIKCLAAIGIGVVFFSCLIIAMIVMDHFRGRR